MTSVAPTDERAAPVVVIEPRRGFIALDLAEVWAYRELLFFLAWRDVKLRYKQTALGAAWAVLQPVLTMLIFTVVFGRLAKVGTDGVPYPVFSYAGLLPWLFFAQGLTQSSSSLVGSANLLKKVYFPRLIIPAAPVLASTVDFVVASLVLFVLMALYGIWPTATVVFLPLLALLAASTALGVGLWFSALNVEFRDVRYVLPFVIQLGLFVTPVIYPASRLSAWLVAHGLPGWLYGVNPMAAVVEGFRWAVFRTGAELAGALALGTAIALLLVVTGAVYFKRVEKGFADLV
jgi:lipopolysaccharide transport system permease protein